MNKKMNRQKKNAGFSLIELIVVVLIMAVIAVVLAPQIMKWVENSRLSTDNQNLSQLVSNVQLALAKESALKEVVASDGNKEIIISATGADSYTGLDSATNFKNELKDITGAFPKPSSSNVVKFVITIEVGSHKVKTVTGKALDKDNNTVDLSNLG